MVGGGYIGLELGTFFSKVGASVTVVEGGPGLLGGVDPDLAKVVHKNMVARKLSRLSARIKAL